MKNTVRGTDLPKKHTWTEIRRQVAQNLKEKGFEDVSQAIRGAKHTCREYIFEDWDSGDSGPIFSGFPVIEYIFIIMAPTPPFPAEAKEIIEETIRTSTSMEGETRLDCQYLFVHESPPNFSQLTRNTLHTLKIGDDFVRKSLESIEFDESRYNQIPVLLDAVKTINDALENPLIEITMVIPNSEKIRNKDKPEIREAILQGYLAAQKNRLREFEKIDPEELVRRKNTLLTMAIVFLTTIFEGFVRDLCKAFFTQDPRRLKTKEKTIPMSEIIGAWESGATIEYIVEKEVASIPINDGLADYLEKMTPIDLNQVSEWPVVSECKWRRNDLVHYGGRISPQYIRHFKEDELKVGQLHPLDTSYYYSCFHAIWDLVEYCGKKISQQGETGSPPDDNQIEQAMHSLDFDRE